MAAARGGLWGQSLPTFSQSSFLERSDRAFPVCFPRCCALTLRLPGEGASTEIVSGVSVPTEASLWAVRA